MWQFYPTRRHLAMSGGILVVLLGGWRLLLASSGQRPGMLLHMDSPPQQRIIPPHMSIVQRLGKPGLKPVLSVSIQDHTKRTSSGHLRHLSLRLRLSCCWLKWLVWSWLWKRPKTQMHYLSSGTAPPLAGEQHRRPGSKLTLSLKYHENQGQTGHFSHMRRLFQG